jgi:hypothetical protein
MNKIIQPDILGHKAGMLLINRGELARSIGFSSEGEFVEQAFSLVFKQIWAEAKLRANGDGSQVTDEVLVSAALVILFGRVSARKIQ